MRPRSLLFSLRPLASKTPGYYAAVLFGRRKNLKPLAGFPPPLVGYVKFFEKKDTVAYVSRCR